MKDRITIEDIENNIKDIEIVKHTTQSGKILRWAVLITDSGFSVTGKPSAAVNQLNDNEEIGTKIAIENAKEEMWALMGYHLSIQLKNNM